MLQAGKKNIACLLFNSYPLQIKYLDFPSYKERTQPGQNNTLECLEWWGLSTICLNLLKMARKRPHNVLQMVQHEHKEGLRLTRHDLEFCSSSKGELLETPSIHTVTRAFTKWLPFSCIFLWVAFKLLYFSKRERFLPVSTTWPVKITVLQGTYIFSSCWKTSTSWSHL